MHVHAAECSGMKFISVCMQVRRNAAKCKSFMCVCERGENDNILMNAYFIESSNLIYTHKGVNALSNLGALALVNSYTTKYKRNTHMKR